MVQFTLIFLAFIIPLAWTPGPVNITLAAVGTTNGFKPSLGLIAGLNVAFLIQSLLLGFGLIKLFSAYPVIYEIIRFSGIAYLCFLSWRILNLTLGSKSIKLSFTNGMMLSFLNPKVYMTLILMFAQFKAYAEQSEGVILLSFFAMSMFLIGNSMWCFFGLFLRSFIANEKIFTLQKYFFALLLFGVALFMAFA